MKRFFTYILLISIAVACHIETPQRPASKFTFTPGNGCKAPCTVVFKSEAENAKSIQWDFGDGSTFESGDSVRHTFETAKSYQVKMIVRGVDGGSSGSTQTINIEAASREAFSMSGDNNFPTDIASDKNGNIYVSGTARGTIQFGNGKMFNSNAGSDDFFVAKYDSTGQCQWVYMDGSEGNDHANALILGNNNDIYLTGFISGRPAKADALVKGEIDGFVMRLNSTDGKVKWFKTFGGPLSDQGRSLAFDERGEGRKIYLVGVVEGDNQNTNIDLNKEMVKADSRDGFLAMLDGDNGEFQHLSMMRGPNVQIPETVTVDKAGNAYVAGAFLRSISFSTADQSLKSLDTVDVFIAKWGLINKQFIWTARAASDREDFAYDIEVDANQNVYVTGMHKGNLIELPLTSSGDENAFLGKWNANGKAVAGRNGFNDGNRDYHGGIALTKSGNIVIAGSFSSTTGQFPMSSGKMVQGRGVTDIIVTELEPNQLAPTNFLICDGGEFEDRVNKICLTESGYVYVAGWFKTSSMFNNVNLSGASQERNTFIARYKL
jgi:PKD repeat protein